MNYFKTFILMLSLSIILILMGQAIGGQQGMVFALIFAVGMNFFSYWFSDKIVLTIYRAKEVIREEAPELHSIVENLARRANMPKPRICIMDNPAANAFATGRNKNHSVVAVTTGILNILDKNELEGVLGHELTHIKNNDILIATIAATLASAIMVLANMIKYAAIFGGLSRDREERDSGGIAMLALAFLAPLAAILIQLAISRSREYDADEGGGRISGNPLKLADALKKLEISAKRMPLQANPATSHLFIVNPLSASFFMKIFSTHPPTQERIARLEELAQRGV